MFLFQAMYLVVYPQSTVQEIGPLLQGIPPTLLNMLDTTDNSNSWQSPPDALPTYDAYWEGPLRIFSDIVETAWNELMTAELVQLQWRMQHLDGICHHFPLMRLKMRIGLEKEDMYLRWDWRADSNPDSSVLDGGFFDENKSAMLAMSEDRLLRGTTSSIEGTYAPKYQPLPLGSLIAFLRVCCEELDQYCVWPDSSKLFCSVVTEHIAGRCSENVDIKHLKNLANKIRRRIRIKHQVQNEHCFETLAYPEQLELLFSSAKGQAIGTKETAHQLITLESMINRPPPAERGRLLLTLPNRNSHHVMLLSPLLQIHNASPRMVPHIRTKQPLLTVILSETLHDVLQNPKKITVFRDVSKRFQDESTLRGLSLLRGSNATADFADLGWKLVKYRLYVPAADAALLMRGVERLARQLIEKEPCTYHQGLLHETLTAYGEELGGPFASVTKEPCTKKRDVFKDAVAMARLLNDAEPGAHLDSLADSLGSYCLALVELGEYEKASEACRESIEMWRPLYRQRFAELKELGSEGGMQQVFRDWCWCYCTDDEACEAVSELLLIADTVLNETSPVEITDWPTMFSRYGPFLAAAAAAPEGCKTVRMGRPQI